MKLPAQLISDTSHRWLSVSQAAEHFGRSYHTIYAWCVSGFCLDARFKVYRDLTSHYWIGIPMEQIISVPQHPRLAQVR